MPETDSLVTTERVAIVAWKLAAGASPTTSEIAAMVGISRSGAWEMMSRLSRVLPIHQVRNGRRLEWHIVPSV